MHCIVECMHCNFFGCGSQLCTVMAEATVSGSDDEEVNLLGWETFFDELGRFLQSSGRAFESANEEYAKYVVERLEVCIISLHAVKESLQEATANSAISGYLEKVTEMLSICQTLSVKWEQKIDAATASQVYPPPPLQRRSGRGRPRFDITEEQLLYLSSLSFSWSDIAMMLGVSRMTIYRRRVQYGLVQDPASVPTDIQLRTIVREIKHGQPELGEVMVMGRVRSMGYKVTRDRLRQAIRQMDPLHTALRWRGGLTSRRPYSVPGPNSLWHIGMMMTTL